MRRTIFVDKDFENKVKRQNPKGHIKIMRAFKAKNYVLYYTVIFKEGNYRTTLSIKSNKGAISIKELSSLKDAFFHDIKDQKIYVKSRFQQDSHIVRIRN